MKRILFFIESLSVGGAEKVLVTLLKHLDYSQYDVTLKPLVDTGILREDIDMSKLNYAPVIRETKSIWQRVYNKIKYKLIYHCLPCCLVNKMFIPQIGMDAYIAFTEGFSTKLLSYAPGKKVAWVHADLKTDPWTQVSHIYDSLEEEKKVYQKYSIVACVSNAVEHVMRDLYHLHQTKTIYNPIDTEEIIQESKIPSNVEISSAFNIVSVGRLVPQKGFDLLIAVIGKLKHEGKDIHLYIIGEGYERQTLENIIQNEGLQDVVHLMGYMRNPFALMAKMDLYVCSSTSEGYSLVIAEAMTLGLPVLSTLCAGPREILEDGKYGMLVENNVDAIYKGVCRIVDSPELLEELKIKSIEKGKNLGVDKTMKQIVNLFDNI